jgi:hypothetical protein
MTTTGGITVDTTATTWAGTKLAEAGINYTDPGAHTIRVWDDTDHVMANATIGPGIAYNRAAVGSYSVSASATPPTGTGFYHVTGGVMDSAAVAQSGSGSVVRQDQAVMTRATIGQGVNNATAIYGQRNTDSSPTGNFIQLQSAAAADLFRVDINGVLQAGSIPDARIAYTNPGADTIRVWDNTDIAPANATIGASFSYNHSTHTLNAALNNRVRYIPFTIDGGGSAITAGKIKGFVTVPYSGTITAYNIMADAVGGTPLKIKFWKIAAGTAVPTSTNSINTSGVSLSSGTSTGRVAVTGGGDFTTTTVSANDIIACNIESVSSATEISIDLEITLP